MKVLFSEKAEKELDSMDKNPQKIFLKHAEKISEMPPRRHLKFGVPFTVEEVTRQSRMTYQIENDTLHILHCFKDHKEYERWYKSFK